MKTIIAAGLAVLVLSSASQAQQHTMPDSCAAMHAGMGHGDGNMMGAMHAMMGTMHTMMARNDSLDQALDAKLEHMNTARGSQRMDAMVEVLNEMAAQRKVMQGMTHGMMTRMMGGDGGMMMAGGMAMGGQMACPAGQRDSAGRGDHQ